MSDEMDKNIGTIKHVFDGLVDERANGKLIHHVDGDKSNKLVVGTYRNGVSGRGYVKQMENPENLWMVNFINWLLRSVKANLIFGVLGVGIGMAGLFTKYSEYLGFAFSVGFMGFVFAGIGYNLNKNNITK